MRSKFCKCKNTYVQYCENECEQSYYWNQGLGSLKNQNRFNYGYDNLLSANDFISGITGTFNGLIVNEIDGLDNNERLYFDAQNNFVKLTYSDSGLTEYIDSTINQVNYNFNYYTRYKSGNTVNSNLQNIVDGKKINFNLSAGLFTNGLQQITSGNITGSIQTLNEIQGWQWYKISYVSTSEIVNGTNFRFLINSGSSGDYELFYISAY